MKKVHLHTFSLTNVEDEDLNNSSSSSIDLLQVEKKNKNEVGVSKILSNWASRSFQKKNFVRKLPILSWLPNYKFGQLLADFIAGLTLGLTTIPQVLGVANVAEMPPEVDI